MNIQLAIWAGVLVIGSAAAAYWFWAKFAPDIRTSLGAIKLYFTRSHNEPPQIKYPENVLPFMTPDRQQFLKSRTKHQIMQTPMPKQERRK